MLCVCSCVVRRKVTRELCERGLGFLFRVSPLSGRCLNLSLHSLTLSLFSVYREEGAVPRVPRLRRSRSHGPRGAVPLFQALRGGLEALGGLHGSLDGRATGRRLVLVGRASSGAGVHAGGLHALPIRGSPPASQYHHQWYVWSAPPVRSNMVPVEVFTNPSISACN